MSISPADPTKLDSRRLRGSLLESLADPVTAALHESDPSLLKSPCIYQQANRYLRKQRRLAQLDPAHSFTIRPRTPCGAAPPAHLLHLTSLPPPSSHPALL